MIRWREKPQPHLSDRPSPAAVRGDESSAPGQTAYRGNVNGMEPSAHSEEGAALAVFDSDFFSADFDPDDDESDAPPDDDESDEEPSEPGDPESPPDSFESAAAAACFALLAARVP